MADEPETPTTLVEPTAPVFDPADAFKTLQANLEGRIAQMTDNFNAAVAQINQTRQDVRPAQLTDPEITLDEIENVLAEGKGADKLVKMIDSRLKKLETGLAQRISEIESTGTNALSNVASEMARSDMPYYKRYQKEIDAYVATLSPHLRMNKQVYVVAHNAVVGQHLPDIIKEEREKVMREAADPNAAGSPGGAAGRRANGAPADDVPTVEQIFGKEAADALTSVGRTPDQHAQRMGYKTWADYAKFVKEQEAASA